MLKIPKAEKIYTTSYDGFRGVDFTNDPSNVWNRRSPDALNMMPDLAGRPWKRTGWEVVKRAADFIQCYNDTTTSSYSGELTPLKTSYFELAGISYLAISNNLGLFFYSKFTGGSASDSAYLKYIDRYYGEVGTATENTATVIQIAPDANRGFFFEGGGTAGFYMFCTTISGVNQSIGLFRFDGDKLRKIEPFVPLLIAGKSAGDTDSGTIIQYPNILTTERIVQFIGDGSSKDFILPELADTAKPLKVEVMANGEWTTKATPADYSTSVYVDRVSGETVTQVSFIAAPAVPDVAGEDNVKVTYSIVLAGTSEQTTEMYGEVTQKTVITQQRTVTYFGNQTATTNWENVNKTSEVTTAEFTCPNVIITNGVPKITIKPRSNRTTWSNTPIPSSNLVTRYAPYSNKITVKIKDASSYWGDSVEEISPTTELSSNVQLANPELAQFLPQIPYDQRFKTVVVQQRTITKKQYVPVKAEIKLRVEATSNGARNAFEQCSRVAVYGNGLINSVFMTGSSSPAFKSRVWWSAPTDPSYFPDTNYLEAGSNDTQVVGLMKVGEYLGIIKQGDTFDSTIYLAYPTKVESGSIKSGDYTETTYDDTFAIKESVGGIGAISSGAFNILNSEPLFLSKEGVMGINPTNEKDKQLRNISYFINRKLLKEPNLENAVSFVYRNMYILALNNHCYVLDGAQKNSWANEKTNLQYECYYWNNVPAQCFARYDNELWFTDYDGRLCRFMPEFSASSYHDEYDATHGITTYNDLPRSVLVSNPDITVTFDFATFWSYADKCGQYIFSYESAGYLHRTLFGRHLGNSGHLDTTQTIGGKSRYGDSVIQYLEGSQGWHLNGQPCILSNYGISVSGTPNPNDIIVVNVGNPITATWTTVFDDDGSPNHFKTLRKKGTMVTLYPQSSTGVKVYIRKDNNDRQYIGAATVRSSADGFQIPSDFYLKKKAKKYKRLQIITENDGFDETFGIDAIIKCYTVGNYSKNR